jgi:hypothetical protein
VVGKKGSTSAEMTRLGGKLYLPYNQLDSPTSFVFDQPLKGGFFMKSSIFLFVFLCSVSVAQASENDSKGQGSQYLLSSSTLQESIYWVNYHFTDEAWGKRISRVWIHTGVLRGPEPRCLGRGFEVHPNWESVQHLAMTKKGNHFFAKHRFEVPTGKCQAPSLGPIVQYWIEYTNGDFQMTSPVLVPIQSVLEIQSPTPDQLKALIETQDLGFTAMTDASETAGKMIEWEHAEEGNSW